MEEKETARQWLERTGLAKVRILFSADNIPAPYYVEARDWLAQKDEEERERNVASMEAQMRIALRANKIAIVAAIAAIAAAIMAAVAIVISYLAWKYPVHW
jgi:hypothetical protein